jgi:2-keto-4-pentenoate hydratase
MTRATTSPAAPAHQRAAVATAAERLQVAGHTNVPCPPVRDLIGTADVELAYAVQQRLTERRLAAGARIISRKIGLTSPAVQQQLGVGRPDFGVLFDDMDVSALDAVASGQAPPAESRGRDRLRARRGPRDGPLDAGQVRGAVRSAVAALEIVDSRIARWDITFGDTVADNASSSLFVLGGSRVSLEAFEPAEAAMRMYLDGELVSEGTGAACLGDPLAALAWLARTARDLGGPLRAGQVVLSGALGPMAATPPGARVRAEITGLGPVAATFSGKDDR